MRKRAQNHQKIFLSAVLVIIILISSISLILANSISFIPNPNRENQNSKLTYTHTENQQEITEESVEIKGGESDRKYKIGEKEYSLKRGRFNQDIYLESKDKTVQLRIDDTLIEEGKTPVIKEIQLEEGFVHITNNKGKKVSLPFDSSTQSKMTISKRGEGFSVSFSNKGTEKPLPTDSSKEATGLIEQLNNQKFKDKYVTYIDSPDKQTNFLILKTGIGAQVRQEATLIERDDATIRKENNAYERITQRVELKEAKREGALVNINYEEKKEGDRIEDIFSIENPKNIKLLLGNPQDSKEINNAKWVRIHKSSPTANRIDGETTKESIEKAKEVTISYGNEDYSSTIKMGLEEFKKNHLLFKAQMREDQTKAEERAAQIEEQAKRALEEKKKKPPAEEKTLRSIPLPLTPVTKEKTAPSKKEAVSTRTPPAPATKSPTNEEEPLKWIKPKWIRQVLGIYRETTAG